MEMPLGRIRMDCQHAVEHRHGLGMAVLGTQSRRQKQAGLDVSGVGCDGAVKQVDAACDLAGLQGNCACKIERVEVRRVLGQKAVVDRRGVLQLARLVKPNRLPKGLRFVRALSRHRVPNTCAHN